MVTDLMIIDALYSSFDKDLANRFVKHEDCIIIWLTDGTRVKISQKKTV